MLLDDPGRVRSQIISVVCQIQRFDFDCIMVVSRKVIIRIPPVLGSKPLYMDNILQVGFQKRIKTGMSEILWFLRVSNHVAKLYMTICT